MTDVASTGRPLDIRRTSGAESAPVRTQTETESEVLTNLNLVLHLTPSYARAEQSGQAEGQVIA